MKFIITRTSDYQKKKPPTENATYEEYETVDMVILKDEKERDAYIETKGWKNEGYGHKKVSKTRAQRTLKLKDWFIEVETLDDLLKLMEKEGELIIGQYGRKYPYIEIYDYYRE